VYSVIWITAYAPAATSEGWRRAIGMALMND